MKTLLQKSSLAILSLVLPGAALLAAPSADHLPPWHKRAGFSVTRQTTLQNLWVENFDVPNGSTTDAGSSAWTSAVTYSKAIFSVSNGEFKVNNISVNGLGTWTSAPISIAGKTNIRLSADVRSAGGLENDGTPHADYLRFYYKIDSGPEILFSDMNGIINNNSATDSTVYSTGAISGASLQIIVRAKATATDEFYYFDNITAMGESDCTAAAPEGVTANGSNQVTCNTPQVNLVGFSSTPGVTYNWTGPNGFTASGAVVPVTAGGIYTLKVTNPANGCFKLLPAIVSQNTAPPANVTATNSGPLTCTITGVDIVGNSTDANVDYEWSGPDGYQSFSASDIATEPGEYVLTATNSANGCAINKSTTVVLNCSGERKITPVAPAADNSANAIPAGFEWKAFPNPFAGKAFIGFKPASADFVTIQVYSSMGLPEKTLFNNRVAPGQAYQLTLEGLPAGVHYIVVRINNKLYTQKMMSVK